MAKYIIESYKDKKKESRWRLKASNGKIVAEGAEGYKRESTMLKTIHNIFNGQLIIKKP